MKLSTLLICGIVSSLILAPPALASESGIEVTGAARESVAPDMATFSFAINSRGKELAPLKLEVDRKTAATIAVCKKLGIESSSITSAEVSITPQYNYQTREFLGYEVSRTIKVVLENLDAYTELVNGAIAAGITTIGSITLDTTDRNELENRALATAIEAARQKAEIIARSTGEELGRALYVREGGGQIRHETFQFNQLARAESVEGAFEPGEISLTVNVTVRYALQ